MAKSIVKWFDVRKGYGFIINPDAGDDIFVHYSAIVTEKKYKNLEQGVEVDFAIESTGKGLQAKNVREAAITA
jgi:CspA family cold shock protein